MDCDSYEWTWMDDNSPTRLISVNPVKSGWYYIAVDSASCLGFDSMYVAVGSRPYDGFSPNNGDNFNNYWVIKDIELFDGSTVQIFNRWGTLIFEAKDCPEACWDGMIDGKDAPMGTYYYSIDHNDGSELLQGTITLVR